MRWDYEKVNQNTNVEFCPSCDNTGVITGHIVFGLPTWFDEHPEERKALGWIKHIHPDKPEYNKQTQFLLVGSKVIDEYTVEDYYIVKEKSEEMLVAEELCNAGDGTGIAFVGGHWYEQIH